MYISIDETKFQAVQAAIKNLKRKLGNESVDFLGKFGKDIERERISTGLTSIDVALGGGLPRGDYIEMYGKPSVGKSTLCMWLAGQAQKMGEIVAYIDVETDYDVHWAGINGVNVDELIFSQPNSLEEALTIAEELIKSGGVGLVIIDSLAALTPQMILDRPIDKDTIGVRPRKLAQFCDKTKWYVKASNSIILFTNQYRQDPNQYGKGVAPGGWAVKHNFGVVMEVWRSDANPTNNADLITVGGGDSQEVIASKSHIVVRKNKVAPPYRKASFRIDFDSGVNPYYDLYEYAVSFGVVEQSGSWYKYEGKSIVQGENKFVELLRVDKTLYEKIRTEVRQVAGLDA